MSSLLTPARHTLLLAAPPACVNTCPLLPDAPPEAWADLVGVSPVELLQPSPLASPARSTDEESSDEPDSADLQQQQQQQQQGDASTVAEEAADGAGSAAGGAASGRSLKNT